MSAAKCSRSATLPDHGRPCQHRPRLTEKSSKGTDSRPSRGRARERGCSPELRAVRAEIPLPCLSEDGSLSGVNLMTSTKRIPRRQTIQATFDVSFSALDDEFEGCGFRISNIDVATFGSLDYFEPAITLEVGCEHHFPLCPNLNVFLIE